MDKVLMSDNEGAWYILPKQLVTEFREMLSVLGSVTDYSDKWYDLVAEFDNAFLEYGIDSPNGLYVNGKSWFWNNG